MGSAREYRIGWAAVPCALSVPFTIRLLLPYGTLMIWPGATVRVFP